MSFRTFGQNSRTIDCRLVPIWGHIRPTDNIRMRSRGFMPLCGQMTATREEKELICRFGILTPRNIKR